MGGKPGFLVTQRASARMSLRTDYDVWHERIHTADPAHEDASSPWYVLVSEYVGPVAGLKVLEVACGRGGFVRKLAREGAQVTGCDFSASALSAAASKLAAAADLPRSAVLVQGDAQCLPFASNTFDLVISCETIEHLPQVQEALVEMHRVTRPGGKLLLTTPNYANFMGLYDLYARVRHPGRRDDQPFDRRQWFAQVRRWIRRAGWRILSTDGTVHLFPFFPGRNPMRWEALEANRAVRRLLSPFAYTYFVAAEKPLEVGVSKRKGAQEDDPRTTSYHEQRQGGAARTWDADGKNPPRNGDHSQRRRRGMKAGIADLDWRPSACASGEAR